MVLNAAVVGHLSLLESSMEKKSIHWIFLKNLIKFDIYLAWPFTILQNNDITISWDFLRLTAPAAMPEHLGAVSLKKSHDIVVLSF